MMAEAAQGKKAFDASVTDGSHNERPTLPSTAGHWNRIRNGNVMRNPSLPHCPQCFVGFLWMLSLFF